MYALEFSGWAQCRLPTDPDPSNETRGVSGYTFALAGEPDLDRIIRFQPGPGVVEREGAPGVGVTVTAGWYLDPSYEEPPIRLTAEHALLGARVDLLDEPTFDARNYVVVDNGFGVIWPFRFCIDNGRSGVEHLRVVRSTVIDAAHPERAPIDTEESLLIPYLLSAPVLHSAQVLTETGIVDPIAMRMQRQRLLEQIRAGADPNDVVRIAALDKRIDELRQTGPVNRRTQQIPTKAYCRYPLNGPDASVTWGGVERRPSAEPWNLEMWFGGWDADSLNFFVKGSVILTDVDEA